MGLHLSVTRSTHGDIVPNCDCILSLIFALSFHAGSVNTLQSLIYSNMAESCKTILVKRSLMDEFGLNFHFKAACFRA